VGLPGRVSSADVQFSFSPPPQRSPACSIHIWGVGARVGVGVFWGGGVGFVGGGRPIDQFS